MLTTILLATVPRTLEWSPIVGLIMILCNAAAFAIGRSTIQQPTTGPGKSRSEVFAGLSLGAIVGILCFGHILGTGTILGLSYIGAI